MGSIETTDIIKELIRPIITIFFDGFENLMSGSNFDSCSIDKYAKTFIK